MRLALIAAALCAGCATTPALESVWVKPGATQQEFYTDRGQCQAQAFGPGNVHLMQAAIIMSGCMQGKGWYLQQVSR
jgi:hypothetical protein